VVSHVLFSDRPGALADGEILAGRLLSVVAAGVVFVSYLDVDEIARALGWYLRPVLGWRAARVALMTRLALRSVVLLRRDLSTCRTALASRGLTVRARPLRYLSLLGSNAVVHALMRADQHSEAVASRGYADHHVQFGGATRTDGAPGRAWTWTGAAVTGCAIAWIVGPLT
jgi:energy-coupling factor transporter transmembrane protein EcfT